VSGGPTDDREVAEANAAFIVRAVNAHDDLVKALRTVIDEKAPLYWEQKVDMARAALSKAGA
jgi:hypothetical protein